jgi:hypothetical protein
VKFFLGHLKKGGYPRATLPDEIFLNSPDTYEGLVHKVQAALRWVTNSGYGGVLKLDDDVYCCPERLDVTALTGDYVGQLNPVKMGYPNGFCHGGAGYYLSKKACSIVASTPIPTKEFSEDGFVANALAAKGILGKNDPRFQYTRRVFGDEIPAVPSPDNNLIATGEWHTLMGGKSELYAVHRAFTE